MEAAMPVLTPEQALKVAEHLALHISPLIRDKRIGGDFYRPHEVLFLEAADIKNVVVTAWQSLDVT
jgi:hypothetical protein